MTNSDGPSLVQCGLCQPRTRHAAALAAGRIGRRSFNAVSASRERGTLPRARTAGRNGPAGLPPAGVSLVLAARRRSVAFLRIAAYPSCGSARTTGSGGALFAALLTVRQASVLCLRIRCVLAAEGIGPRARTELSGLPSGIRGIYPVAADRIACSLRGEHNSLVSKSWRREFNK